MTTELGWIGHAPKVTVSNLRPAEKDVYRILWEHHPKYREIAPGEYCVRDFMTQAKPPFNSKIIDLGCGTGRGALALNEAGMDVTMVDFATNCLDPDVKDKLKDREHSFRFVEADLTKELPEIVSAPYGFCTDVMEHIPPKDVDRVLNVCLRACQHVFFQIATADDICGEMIGHKLHLSVHPFEWWLQKFNERDCVIHWSRNDVDSCMFYVSGWITGTAVAGSGLLNTEMDKIKENVKTNIVGGWLQVEPHVANAVEVMLVGGGPSLAENWDEIRKNRDKGMPLIALNGAYGECIKQGINPSALMVVDARSFNARFTKPVIDDCKYFIASQCDPLVFEGLPKDRTYIWHTMTDEIAPLLNEQYTKWYGIPGGSTVLLRAFTMFRMLGYKRFHVFGCDSCLVNNKHHSFEQKENDSEIIIRVRCGDRIFMCHTWMISQAQEFMDTIKFLGDEIEIEVYGDGLLRHILQTGADLFDGDTSEYNGLYDRGLEVTKTSPIPESRRDRFQELVTCFGNTAGVLGNIAECGSFRGLSSFLLCNYAKKEDAQFLGKGYEIYDSFLGLSAPSEKDTANEETSHMKAGHFSASEDVVKNTLSEFPEVTMYPGWIPEAFDKNSTTQYRFVHIDVDLYEPTLASLHFFWPRLSVGGMIVCDDYGWPGAKTAVEEFCSENGINFSVTLLNQACITKLETKISSLKEAAKAA